MHIHHNIEGHHGQPGNPGPSVLIDLFFDGHCRKWTLRALTRTLLDSISPTQFQETDLSIPLWTGPCITLKSNHADSILRCLGDGLSSLLRRISDGHSLAPCNPHNPGCRPGLLTPDARHAISRIESIAHDTMKDTVNAITSP